MTLTAGTHLVPADGSCLMERVSAVAGLRWSDHPSCTHPLVAHVARLVNDMMSDAGRQVLLDRVPRLATPISAAPDLYPRIALACLRVAAEKHPTTWVLVMTRVTTKHLYKTSATDRGVPAAVYRRASAWRAVEAAVAAVSRLTPEERDAALVQMLDASLEGVTAIHSFIPPQVPRVRLSGSLAQRV